MTLQEIKDAIEAGRIVHWSNAGYQVIRDKTGRYLIRHDGGSCIGLTWANGVTMNGKPEDFYVAG